MIKLKKFFMIANRCGVGPLLFGGALSLVWWLHFNVLAVALFFLISGVLYIYPLLNSFVFSASFVVCLLAIGWWLIEIQAHPVVAWLSIVTYTALWQLLMLLKNNRIVAERVMWYSIGRWVLLYLLALSFFIHADTFFGVKMVALAVGMMLMWREWLKIINQRVTREDLFIAVAVTAVTMEVAWVLTWLPIGFFAAANSLFLWWYVAELLITNKFGNRYKYLLLGALVLISIVATAQWRL